MPPRPQNMTGDFKTIILSGGSAPKDQKTTEIRAFKVLGTWKWDTVLSKFNRTCVQTAPVIFYSIVLPWKWCHLKEL